ncbi:ketoacyl-ACP synthase III [Pollutibacter soli]|uniref:3-oxoacyl-ACP synthase III family protein n=1 Tax=Pollutibacter soli TaxID=3034157 RepID=UPI003013F284
MLNTVITGTGAFIPETVQFNTDFLKDVFYEANGSPILNTTAVTITKFHKVTGIRERRYLTADICTSDMAAEAARKAIENASCDPESLDQIILAHNFGDISPESNQSRIVPSLASRVKHLLGIRNPDCVAYDIIFGCPGWLQGFIQAHSFLSSGMAKRILLIGAESLSRVIDRTDRDSMIFADGAGACILEYKENLSGSGVLGFCSQSHSGEIFDSISMGKSYGPENGAEKLFLKMKGRKVYEFAIRHVPQAMKKCLEISRVDISEIRKIFLHQANEKMDEEILRRFYELYGIREPAYNVMPMSIHWLGNSSVATIPTLYDLVSRGEIPEHKLHEGDAVLFASVGAGMNINALCYRI